MKFCNLGFLFRMGWLFFWLSRFCFAEMPVRVLILGDSLTEGYGVSKEQAYPFLVQQKLRAAGKEVEIINGGSSGATTAGAVSRLKWYLKKPVRLVMVALGANDGLRGLKVTESEKNLREVIDLAKKGGAKVLLAGMKLPPNYGTPYVKDFEKMFQQLSKSESVPLIPFLLEGVGGNPTLNQEDGIHPNEKGHAKVADVVYPYLLKNL